MRTSGTPPESEGLTLQKQSILVVNDDEDGLFLLAHNLERSFPGSKILTALSGSEALKILAEETPGAIVTDNQMPGMTGVMMVRKIRETDIAVPIVMVSGSTRFRDEALLAGVTVFYFDTGPAGVTAALNECFARVSRTTE